MKYQITVDKNYRFDCDEQSDLISAAKTNNIAMPSGCCGGECGGCVAKLTSGEVSYQSGYQANILTKEQQADGMIVCCMAQPKSDISLMCQQQEKTPRPEQKTMQVLAKNQLTEDVLQLILSPIDQQPLAFRPGQFIEVLLAGGAKRCYSIANAGVINSQSPNVIFSNAIELHIKKHAQGLFSDITCAGLSLGDHLEVNMPLGNFYWRKEINKPIVLAATGTGLAPMQGIIQEILQHKPTQEIHLYWGCRAEQDLYQHTTLLQLKHHHNNFHYTPVLSQADAHWQGKTGYLHQAIVEQHPKLSDFAIYLAGSEIMIKRTKQVLLAFGLNPEQLFCDLFLPAKVKKAKSRFMTKIANLFGKKSVSS